MERGQGGNMGVWFWPDVLVSLTAPKLCSKEFRGRNFMWGEVSAAVSGGEVQYLSEFVFLMSVVCSYHIVSYRIVPYRVVAPSKRRCRAC